MRESLSNAHSAITKAKKEQAQYYNHCQLPAPKLKVRDHAWLDVSDIAQLHPAKKISHCWLGPYTITKVIRNGSYKLALPKSMSWIHPVFLIVNSNPLFPIP